MSKDKDKQEDNKNNDLWIIDEYTRDLERELEKELVEEEKNEWMWIWKDVEEMKRLWLLEHEDKLKKGEKKANFG